MRRGIPLRRKPHSSATSAHRCNRHRHKRRTERRRSRLRYAAPCHIGQHCQRHNIRRFTLIGGHALGRISLHMFDRSKVLSRSQLNIFYMHVVLIIDPLAALTGHRPNRRDDIRRRIGVGQHNRLGLQPKRLNHSLRDLRAVQQTAHRMKHTVTSTHRDHIRHSPRSWDK